MKSAKTMTDEELANEEATLKPRATKHSPVCTCEICRRYVQVGTERYDREIARFGIRENVFE